MKRIEKSVIVAGSRADVWKAWTTTEGAVSFFAPKANIQLEIGGSYELFFDLDQSPGLQGSEDMRILSYLPERLLSFEWNAPPQFPNVRAQRTWVVVEFNDLGRNAAEVRLTHLGWQSGDEWDQAYAYFDHAWDMVMFWVMKRFADGPIDWSNPPEP